MAGGWPDAGERVGYPVGWSGARPEQRGPPLESVDRVGRSLTAYGNAIEAARSVQACPVRTFRVADRETSWSALVNPQILDDSPCPAPVGTAQKRDVVTDKG